MLVVAFGVVADVLGTTVLVWSSLVRTEFVEAMAGVNLNGGTRI